MWNLKTDTNECICKTETESHTHREQESVYQMGMGRQREKLGVWIKRYKQLCIKQIHNKDKLYSTGSYSHYLVITFNGM